MIHPTFDALQSTENLLVLRARSAALLGHPVELIVNVLPPSVESANPPLSDGGLRDGTDKRDPNHDPRCYCLPVQSSDPFRDGEPSHSLDYAKPSSCGAPTPPGEPSYIFGRA